MGKNMTQPSELDQESEQALLLEEVYELGYHKIKNGCLQEPLERLNKLIQQEKNKLLDQLIAEAVPNPTTPAGEPEFVPVEIIKGRKI